MKRKKKSVALQRSQITLRSELFPTFTTQFITLKYQSNADTFQQLVIHHNQLDLSEPSLRADNPVVKPSSALIPVRVVRSMLSLSFKEVKKSTSHGCVQTWCAIVLQATSGTVVHIKQCEADGNEVLTTEVSAPREATLYHLLSHQLLPLQCCVLTCFFLFFTCVDLGHKIPPDGWMRFGFQERWWDWRWLRDVFVVALLMMLGWGWGGGGLKAAWEDESTLLGLILKKRGTS